jgi:hypothetical protein
MTKAAFGALFLAGVLMVAVGCGGGSSHPSTRNSVSGAGVAGGTAPAVFHSGALPAPTGSLTVSVPSDASGINGGSVVVTVTASGTIVTVYVSVQGSDGYWEIPVPAGATVADVLLTLAQQLSADLTIVFEVADAAGNISAPATVMTAVTHVINGEVQVSVAWDALNDIDLRVVDPLGFEVSWEGRTSPEGGQLDLDSNAGCITPLDGVNNEHIVWPVGAAPRGTYTVRVDNFENCSDMLTNFVVTVQTAGHPAQTFAGTFAADDAGDFGVAPTGSTAIGRDITTFTW